MQTVCSLATATKATWSFFMQISMVPEVNVVKNWEWKMLMAYTERLWRTTEVDLFIVALFKVCFLESFFGSVCLWELIEKIAFKQRQETFKKLQIYWPQRPLPLVCDCVRPQQEFLSAKQTPQRPAVRMKAEKCFSVLELNVEIDVQI